MPAQGPDSFYKHKSVNTWASTFDDLVLTLNHVVSRPRGKTLTIIDTKVITEGAQSDHLPIRLSLKVHVKRQARGKHACLKPRLKRSSQKSSLDCDLIAKAGKNRKRFNSIITNALQEKPSDTELAKRIVEAAKETSGVEKKVRQDQFEKNENNLLPAISERNIAQSNVISKPTNQPSQTD